MQQVAAREADFWDREAQRTVEESLPDPRALLGHRSFQALTGWLGDLRGRVVLDVCCGTGASTVALALAGAQRVVGLDVSETSLGVGRRLARACGCADRVEFVAARVEDLRSEWEGAFDALYGTYALHHLDLVPALANLARYLVPGGRGAFLETSSLNPVLRWCRAHVAGRGGIPRFSTPDEHPLGRRDFQLCATAFGRAELRPHEVFNCFGLFDRQVLRYRHPTASRVCQGLDAALAHVWPSASYHTVVACIKV